MRCGFRTKQLMLASLATLTIAVSLPLVASSQMTTTADSWTGHIADWHFGIGLYGWLVSAHGDLKSPDGTQNEFTVPFSEILKRVKAGLMAVGEVNWRNWFLVFDGTWATLDGDQQGQVFNLDVKLKQQIYDIHGVTDSSGEIGR